MRWQINHHHWPEPFTFRLQAVTLFLYSLFLKFLLCPHTFQNRLWPHSRKIKAKPQPTSVENNALTDLDPYAVAGETDRNGLTSAMGGKFGWSLCVHVGDTNKYKAWSAQSSLCKILNCKDFNDRNSQQFVLPSTCVTVLRTSAEHDMWSRRQISCSLNFFWRSLWAAGFSLRF